MDFVSMKRKELQSLCKKYKIPANMSNSDMVDALSTFLKVEDNTVNESEKTRLEEVKKGNVEGLLDSRGGKVKEIGKMSKAKPIKPDLMVQNPVNDFEGLGLKDGKDENRDVVVNLDPDGNKVNGQRKTRKTKDKMLDPIVEDEGVEKVEVDVLGRITRGRGDILAEVKVNSVNASEKTGVSIEEENKGKGNTVVDVGGKKVKERRKTSKGKYKMPDQIIEEDRFGDVKVEVVQSRMTRSRGSTLVEVEENPVNALEKMGVSLEEEYKGSGEAVVDAGAKKVKEQRKTSKGKCRMPDQIVEEARFGEGEVKVLQSRITRSCGGKYVEAARETSLEEENIDIVLDPHRKKLKGGRTNTKTCKKTDPVTDEGVGKIEVKVLLSPVTRSHVGKLNLVELPVGGLPNDKKEKNRRQKNAKNLPSVVEENSVDAFEKSGLEEAKERNEEGVLNLEVGILKDRKKMGKTKSRVLNPIIEDKRVGNIPVGVVPTRTTRSRGGDLIEAELPSNLKKLGGGRKSRKNAPTVIEMGMNKSCERVDQIRLQEEAMSVDVNRKASMEEKVKAELPSQTVAMDGNEKNCNERGKLDTTKPSLPNTIIENHEAGKIEVEVLVPHGSPICGSSTSKKMTRRGVRTSKNVVNVVEMVTTINSEQVLVQEVVMTQGGKDINGIASGEEIDRNDKAALAVTVENKKRKGVNTRINVVNVEEVGINKSCEDVHVGPLQEAKDSPGLKFKDCKEGGVLHKKGRKRVQDKNDLQIVKELAASKFSEIVHVIPMQDATKSPGVKVKDDKEGAVYQKKGKRGVHDKETGQMPRRETRSNFQIGESVEGKVSLLGVNTKTARGEKSLITKMRAVDESCDMILNDDIFIMVDGDVHMPDDLCCKPEKCGSKRKATASTVANIVPKFKKKPKNSIVESGVFPNGTEDISMLKDEIVEKARSKVSKCNAADARKKDMVVEDDVGLDELIEGLGMKMGGASNLESEVLSQVVVGNVPRQKGEPMKKGRGKASKINFGGANKKIAEVDDVSEPNKFRNSPEAPILKSGLVASKNSKNIMQLEKEPVKKAQCKTSKHKSVEICKKRLGLDEPSELVEGTFQIIAETSRRTRQKIITVEPPIQTTVVEGADAKTKAHRRQKKVSDIPAVPPRKSGRNTFTQELVDALGSIDIEEVEEKALTKDKPASKLADKSKARKTHVTRGKKTQNLEVKDGRWNLEVVDEKENTDNPAPFIAFSEVAPVKVQQYAGPSHAISVGGLVLNLQQANVMNHEGEHGPSADIGRVQFVKGTSPKSYEEKPCQVNVHTSKDFENTDFRNIGDTKQPRKVAQFKIIDYVRNLQSATASKSDEPAHVSKSWDGNGIPNSTTKYKEDQIVTYHATPFEERIEKALEKHSKS